MKKGFFLLTSLIFFLTSLFAQTKDEESERLRIAESKIKTITQWTHRFSQGKVNPTGHKTSETHYDRKGNPVEIVNYRSNGEISTRLLYKYNDQNLKTEYMMYQKKERPELEVTYKQTFHYNPKGLKTHEIVFDGVTGYRITYEYFPNDQLKEIKKFGAGNVIDEKWVYSYSDNTQEIKIFIPDNNLSAVVTKIFDAQNNLISETRTDSKGKELKRTTYLYNSKGRVIEVAEYYSGNLTKKVHNKFNNQDFLVEVIHETPDGKKFTQATYNYDNKGNVIEEKWSEDNSSEFSHKQSQYDKDGILLETDSYFAPYRYRVLYKYTFNYY